MGMWDYLKEKAHELKDKAVATYSNAKATVTSLKGDVLGTAAWLPATLPATENLAKTWTPPKSLADGGTPAKPVELSADEWAFAGKMGVLTSVVYSIFKQEWALAAGKTPAEALKLAFGLDTAQPIRLGSERWVAEKMFRLPPAPGFKFADGSGPTGAVLFRQDGAAGPCNFALAFRGTMPNGTGEIASNFDIAPAPCEVADGCGTTHRGLQSHYMKHYHDQVMAALQEVDAACPAGWHLAVTGHSLGGAMATFAFADILTDSPLQPGGPPEGGALLPNLRSVHAATFAGWQVGDAEFGRFFDSLLRAGGEAVSFDRLEHFSPDRTFSDIIPGSHVALTPEDRSHSIPLVHVGRQVPVFCPADASPKRCPVLKKGKGFYDKGGAKKGWVGQILAIKEIAALHLLSAHICDAPAGTSRWFDSAYGPNACGRSMELDAETQVRPYAADEDGAALDGGGAAEDAAGALTADWPAGEVYAEAMLDSGLPLQGPQAEHGSPPPLL